MKITAVRSMVMVLLMSTPSAAADKILSPGDFFPDYRIQTELSTADAAYLGVAEEIKRKGYFVAEDVWGDVLVLELLNRFCFGCQQGASIINKAYEITASDPGLSRLVRFLGIGVGNSGESVDEFRREFSVPFPLVPDPDFRILDAVGNPGGTPYTMIFRRTAGGFVLMRVHFGVLDSAEKLIDQIREVSGGDPRELLADRVPVTLAPWLEKELVPPLTEKEMEDRILGSMERAGYGSVGLYSVDLPDGEKVYIGESGRGKAFSMVISRLPVCDICHPVHFILTVNTRGMVVDFDAIAATKYWNEPWNAQEVAKMRRSLLGRSVFDEIQFDPSVDAVTTATMSSSLIFDSLRKVEPVMELLRRGGHL